MVTKIRPYMIYWDTQQAADFDQNQNHISFKTFLAWKTEQPTSQSVFDDSLTANREKLVT